MPHVIIKLWPGRSEEQKMELANRISNTLKETINVSEDSISIAFEEIPKEVWVKEVYNPDIIDKESLLYIKPGYTPEDLD
jgi:4-oxalocrotonate tautomerase